MLGLLHSTSSSTVTKRYGPHTSRRFCPGNFPCIDTCHADGRKGPQIRAAHSGTIPSETGLLPSLFLKECSDLRGEEVPGRKMEQTETGVTIVELHCVPEEHLYTERPDTAFSIVALILITVSIGTSVACVYFQH